MNETTRPHDAFFKALLTQPGAAGVFLRERLPANVAALLSADEPVLEPASFIDAALREHHSDLLFRVSTVTGTTAFVYVLVEHKSYPDPLVGFQLLRYLVAIWQRYLTDGGRRPLPAIVPLVVYHGAERWNVSRDFAALFEPFESLTPYCPSFCYELSDLGTIADAELSRFVLLRSGLMALKHALLRRSGVDLEAIVATELSGNDFTLTLLRYILTVYEEVDRPTLKRVMTRLQEEGNQDMVSIIAREWLEKGEAQGLAQGLAKGMRQGMERGIAQGLERGLSEGLAKGEAKGLVQGEARILMRILERRFGGISKAVRERIEEADPATLENWADRAVDAATLDDVFAVDRNQ
jgi:predicted transposase/invertase (TIGR01784 family)